MNLMELWVWPMAKAEELFGPASIIFALPYYIASVILASIAVLGTIWGGVVMFLWLLVGQ